MVLGEILVISVSLVSTGICRYIRFPSAIISTFPTDLARNTTRTIYVQSTQIGNVDYRISLFDFGKKAGVTGRVIDRSFYHVLGCFESHAGLV